MQHVCQYSKQTEFPAHHVAAHSSEPRLPRLAEQSDPAARPAAPSPRQVTLPTDALRHAARRFVRSVDFSLYVIGAIAGFLAALVFFGVL